MYRAGLLTGTSASALMFLILTTTWKDQGPFWSVQATVAERFIFIASAMGKGMMILYSGVSCSWTRKATGNAMRRLTGLDLKCL